MLFSITVKRYSLKCTQINTGSILSQTIISFAFSSAVTRQIEIINQNVLYLVSLLTKYEIKF